MTSSVPIEAKTKIFKIISFFEVKNDLEIIYYNMTSSVPIEDKTKIFRNNFLFRSKKIFRNNLLLYGIKCSYRRQNKNT